MGTYRFLDLYKKINWHAVIGLTFILVGSFLVFSLFGYLIEALKTLWDGFRVLDKSVAAAIVAGIFTVVATTITMFVGRYYEEKRKRAELHRDKKIEMYDNFIAEIFRIFAQSGKKQSDTDKIDLVEFLREHQRQFLLWSNAGVIRSYSEWQKSLQGDPNAQTVLMIEKIFLSVRKDLGHSNWGIKKGDTVRFLLRNTDFFLAQIKQNPNITLEELSHLEKENGLD